MDKQRALIVSLVIVNIIYWGCSEYYIHDGSFVYGCLTGLLVSFLAVVGGRYLGKAIGGEW